MEDPHIAEPVTQFRVMTSAQRAAWGRAELSSRVQDLVDHGHAVADAKADERRMAIGASHREATALVGQAARRNRKAEAQRQRAACMQPVLTTAQVVDLARLGRVAVAAERGIKGRQYDRDLTAQQQGLANVGLLEGWK